MFCAASMSKFNYFIHSKIQNLNHDTNIRHDRSMCHLNLLNTSDPHTSSQSLCNI